MHFYNILGSICIVGKYDFFCLYDRIGVIAAGDNFQLAGLTVVSKDGGWVAFFTNTCEINVVGRRVLITN